MTESKNTAGPERNSPLSQNSFNHEELVACGAGTLFGDTGPRLPTANMLMMDRVALITSDGGKYGKGEVVAELDIDPDLWFFKCHFTGDPVMPGCLGLDALWQIVGFFLGWSGAPGRGRALGAGSVKFSGQVLPTAKLVTYNVQIKRMIMRKLVLAIADGTVSVDGRVIYEAEDLRVGLFTSTEGF